MRGAYNADRQSSSKDFEGMQVKAQGGKIFNETLEDRIGSKSGNGREQQMLCGCREQNLRKIVTKNYSLPAVNIPYISTCASNIGDHSFSPDVSTETSLHDSSFSP